MVHYIHLEMPKESVSSGMKTLPARCERARPRTVFLRAARKVNEDREVAGFSSPEKERNSDVPRRCSVARLHFLLLASRRIPLFFPSLSLSLSLSLRFPILLLLSDVSFPQLPQPFLERNRGSCIAHTYRQPSGDSRSRSEREFPRVSPRAKSSPPRRKRGIRRSKSKRRQREVLVERSTLSAVLIHCTVSIKVDTLGIFPLRTSRDDS